MKQLIISSLIALGFYNTVFSQDISRSEVPSVVLNKFHQIFPKITNEEWEFKNGFYKAEFETGILDYDHDVWFNETGTLIKHKQEISENELPKAVKESIANSFSEYRKDDIEKITENKKSVYIVQLEKMDHEIKVTFDEKGTVLRKVND